MKKIFFLSIAMVALTIVSVNAQSTTTKSKAQITSEPVKVTTADAPVTKTAVEADKRMDKPATNSDISTATPTSTSPNRTAVKSDEVINSGNRVNIDRKQVEPANTDVKRVNADTKPKK